jgi:TRAP-type mannitol/chloroaromatic compound transport system permease large subunit
MAMRKEMLFGFTIMALIVIPVLILTPWTNLFDAHLDKADLGVLGLLMLALIVVAIMLGFPTAFTLMGMGVFFSWLAYRSVDPQTAVARVLDLFVQRTYGVMSNDVLIAIPLFLFMGYLVERAQLIDRLFHSLHLATARVPGSLAVATIVTCAIFATATGIVGAVVTLMGLLAFPAMLKAGYNIKVSAGALTAGGCLGILIPPSVLLIVYGATAGVSVVQLYAGAFFPGFLLAFLYIGYVVVLAKWKPQLMPPLPESERRVPFPAHLQALAATGGNALTGLARRLTGPRTSGVAQRTVLAQFAVSLVPALAIAAIVFAAYRIATAPTVEASTLGLVEAGGAIAAEASASEQSSGLIGAPEEEAGQEGQSAGELAPPPGAEEEKKPAAEAAPASAPAAAPAAAEAKRLPAPNWFWIMLAAAVAITLLIYWLWNWERLQVFKMLLTSFFPLAVLILAVLGSIVVGLATPAEAAAVGAFGGFVLAAIYRFVAHWHERPAEGSVGRVLARTTMEFGRLIKESSFLTAKTSAMVCWLFVGSGIFSAAFALLGGQEIVEKWVLSLNMTPLQFMILAQLIIFILGWPLEWTEIIIIFMPIFIPLLPHFTPAGMTPDQFALFFGLLVALNLQTAFLSPPVAMAAFYLKGVSPPHVTLNQIFAGMLPFMGIQVIALVLLYTFPQIGLWAPSVFYAR